MDDWLVWKYFGLTVGFVGAPASPAAPAKPALPASMARRVSSLVIGILLLLLNIARSKFSILLVMQTDHTKICISLLTTRLYTLSGRSDHAPRDGTFNVVGSHRTVGVLV